MGGIIVARMLYGRESWALNVKNRKRIDVLEVKCLGRIVRDMS